MRQDLIRQIARRWSELGIPFQSGGIADLTVHTEFLDANWSSGNKKISYEASVYADESASTVFMYEKMTEVGQGLSFGSDGESDFQSGKTLYRKIKSVQNGPNGIAYEINLDLGAIPKAVKETAKASGWHFKTVLNRNKASYPPGFAGTSVADFQQPGRRTHRARAFSSNGVAAFSQADIRTGNASPVGCPILFKLWITTVARHPVLRQLRDCCSCASHFRGLQRTSHASRSDHSV